jgi:ribosomal protein L40E
MMDQSNACPRCGAERPAHAAFCSKCGTRMPPQKTESARASDPDDRGRGGAQTPTPQMVSPERKKNGKTAQLIIFGLLFLFSVWMLVGRLSHGAPLGFSRAVYGESKYAAVHYLLDLFPILYVLIIALFLGLFVAAALDKSSPDRVQPLSQGPMSDASGIPPRGAPDLPTPSAKGRGKLPRWVIALLVVLLLLVVLGLSLDAYNTFGGSNGAARPLASSLRHFQRGDAWEYRVSGTASLPGGRTGTITGGTLKVAITGLEIADFNNLTETNDIALTFSLVTVADGSIMAAAHTTRKSAMAAAA